MSYKDLNKLEREYLKNKGVNEKQFDSLDSDGQNDWKEEFKIGAYHNSPTDKFFKGQTCGRKSFLITVPFKEK